MLFCLNFLGRPCSDADPDQHVLLSLAVIALLYVLGFFFCLLRHQSPRFISHSQVSFLDRELSFM